MPHQGEEFMRWMGMRAPVALALMACATAHAAQGDTRTLPSQVQDEVAQIAQSLTQVRDTETELSCGKAVENARYGLETMIEVGQKNTDAGYMKREEFVATVTQLRGFMAQLTQADCAASSGNRQAFYRCMSSDYNHVTACAAQHRF